MSMTRSVSETEELREMGLDRYDETEEEKK